MSAAYPRDLRAAIPENVVPLRPSTARSEREVSLSAVEELCELERVMDAHGVDGEPGEPLAERLSRFFAPHEVQS